MALGKIAENKSFGGLQLRYQHRSAVLDCDMTFSIYLPPQALANQPVPVIYWLSGLTCTDENFVQKAGAQCYAAQHGVAIVTPDTSPRGEDVPDAPSGAYDFGLGAGFYVDATVEPWRQHYQMYSYIVDELPTLVEKNFPVDGKRTSIMGHSMGGHGALTIALKNPGRYKAVSAFAPISSPMECPWGQKALAGYLGGDTEAWRRYDATELLAAAEERLPLLIDQGDADIFLEEQLKPELLQLACEQYQHPLTLRMQPGYDHSYFFIASFIGDHIAYHAEALGR
jgi:S-formylglutathione hydrolase